MSKKIRTILFIIIFVLLTILTISICSNNKKSSVKAAESTSTDNETSTPSLKVECTSYNGSNFIPDSATSKKIYIKFSLTNYAKTGDDPEITVKFHAEDRSASSEAGDYYYESSSSGSKSAKDRSIETHQIQTVTFTAGSVCQISYVISNPQFVVKNTSDGTYYYPYFVFVLDEIDGASFPTKTENDETVEISEYNCQLYYYSYVYPVKASDNKLVSIIEMEQIQRKVTTGTMYHANYNDDHEYNYTWDIFPSKTFDGIEYTNSSLRDIYISTGLASACGQLYYEMDRTNAASSADACIKLVIGGKTAGEASHDWFLDENHYLSFNSNFTYRDSSDKNERFKVPKEYSQVKCYNWSNYEPRTYTTIDLRTWLEDLTSPTVVNCYSDASSMAKNGVLRIAVRFSEPVQVTDTKEAYIQAKINNGGGDKNYKFNYVGGNYTNTLIFEGTLADANCVIEKINVFKISKDYICDLGKCYKSSINKLQSDTVNVTISCKYDFRKPIIKASVENYQVVTYSKKATVTVSSIIKGAKLYYAWRDDAKATTNISDYQGLINLDSVKDEQATVYPMGSNMYGSYFLHIYVITYYGRTQTYVIGRGKSGETTAGGFLFDNKEPEINETKKLIDKLTNRTFSISAMDGENAFDSGIDTIYARISTKSDMSDYTDYPIWDKTANSNTMGIRDDVYQLSKDTKFYYTEIDPNTNQYAVKTSMLLDNSKYDYNVFSSKEAAIEYIKVTEYRDFELVQLTANSVGYLSQDTNGYVKASGEVETPEIGQKWIRYKTANFDPTKEVYATSWVYYFYKPQDVSTSVIKIDDISDNLKNAVQQYATCVVENYGSQIRSILALQKDNTTGLPDISRICHYANGQSFTTAHNGTQFEIGLNYVDKKVKMNSSVGKGTLSLIAAEDSIVKVMPDSFQIYYIGFYAVDVAGNSNVSSMSYQKYKFDTRGTFNTNVVVQQNGINSLSIDPQINSFDLTYGNVDVVFEAVLDSSKGEVGTVDVSMVKVGDDYLEESEYLQYLDVIPGGDHVITFRIKRSGYYELEIKLVDGDSEKVSKTYEVYITNGFLDDTINKEKTEGNLVLTNDVYQLGSQFTYLNKNNDIVMENYGGTLSPATFSSGSEARNYIQYMEYQDLYLVQLNEYMAQMLSTQGGGSSNYILAPDESHEIKTGQYWIRYKRATWTQTSSTNDWVYYYYSDVSNKISFTNLSTNLQKSISSVVETIYSYGKSVSLVGTSQVGSSYLDSNGAPKLFASQIHFESETAETSKCGSEYSSSAQYAGDKAIYSSKVNNRIDKEEVPICTNMDIKVTETTIIQYAYYDGSMDESQLIFTTVTIPYGVTDTTMKNILANCGTGTYVIREYDNNGISQYKIYYDKSAPRMQLSYTSTVEGKTFSFEVDSQQNGQTFNAKSFNLGELQTKYEYDTQSYVAVYKNRSYDYIETYYYNDLLTKSISLDEGNYYIEVGDRSGNIYSFVIQVCTTKMETEIKTVDNQYIQVTVNRTKDQMKFYSVKVDGKTIDTEWTGDTKKYKEAGFYEITIEDIYGYQYELSGEGGVGYKFVREFPTVEWYYSSSVSSSVGWTLFDESKTTLMKIVESIGGYRYVSSSRLLRFKLDGQYDFEIQGIKKEQYTVNDVNGTVTINTQEPYTVIVYYKEFPDIKTTYNVTTDILPPTIYPSYKITTYTFNENNYFASLTEDELIEGTIYNPTDLGYYSTGVNSNSISDKEYVDVNLIDLDIYDDSGVSKVQIYLNGELYKEYNLEEGKFSTEHLSRYGHYEIIAQDVFENKTTLEFYNTNTEQVKYSLDSIEYKRTDELIYGNDSAIVEVLADSDVYILVTDQNGKQYYVSYCIQAGEVTRTYYKVILVKSDSGTERLSYQKVNETIIELDNMGKEFERNVTVFSTTDAQFKAGKWYLLEGSETLSTDETKSFGANVYGMFDKNGYLYFKVIGTGERISVDTRISLGEEREPYLYKAVLSKETTDILLQTSSDTYLETNKNKEMIYVNKQFFLSSSLDSLITSIEMTYSEMNEFKELTKIYPADETGSLLEFDTTKNGFYKILITNKFGNVNEYYINKSDIFTLITVAKYDDDSESRFDNEYTDIVKANRKITIEAYASKIKVDCFKDGELYEASSKNENGFYTILLHEYGLYDITITDTFGNTFNRICDLKDSTISYNENFIYGYNEIATRKSEGYTNYKLSISNDEMKVNNIKYISVIYNEKENVIYNGLTQYAVDYDENALIDAIGKDGDGVYTVVFRDSYGSTAKKTIHYRKTPTLHIERTTRTSKAPEVQDIEKVVNDGVWCNAIVHFSTDAVYYEFMQLNDDTSLFEPREITEDFSLATTADNIHREFKVYYLDEYGFEYTIDIYLVRVVLEIKLDESINIVNIGNVETTKDNLVLTYSDNATCYYTINGDNQKNYTKGSTLYRDGIYRFTCVDKAGNLTTKTIKKDTIVEYNFINTTDNRVLINGDAVNSKKVEFRAANDDTAYIKTIYLNGVKQEKSDLVYLTEAGKYSIILEDKIGNNTMFEFIIINHKLMEFEYTTPNNYFITDLWYNSADEVSISYIENVTNTDVNSTFNINENGYYTVVMMSKVYNDGMTFSFEIDNTPPDVALVGCNENETTIENITLSGYSIGDTIFIYKDGKLESTTEITSKNIPSPVIDEGGKYTVVIRNQAGVETSLSFNRIYVPNTAGSVLIITICFVGVLGILIGMILKNKQKFDD